MHFVYPLLNDLNDNGNAFKLLRIIVKKKFGIKKTKTKFSL